MLDLPHGQEIYLFFYKFGINGILGLILCTIIITFVIYKSLNIIYLNNINSYKDFLEIIIGKSKKKYLNLSFIINNIINIFLIITFFIMIAGFGTYFNQEFGLNKIIGACILSMMCYFLFMGDIKKITNINSLIIPILIVFIILIGIKNINTISIKDIGKNTIIDKSFFWIIKSVLYASYNLILLIPVLINMKKFIKNKKHILKVSLLTGSIILVISLLCLFLLVNVDISFLELEMPIVYVINKFFTKYKILYGIILLISIFTTAVSIGKSFLNNICINKKSYTQKAALLCITSVIVSNFGFSNLVKVLFPLFGYLGIFQILLIINTK